jgi:SAM-dependent methyltransferase
MQLRTLGGSVLAAIAVSGPLAWAQAPARPLDVPYVPTSASVVEAMLKLADVKSTDVVYDLGCGDGRIVIAAARDFGARGVCIDINPVRVAEARDNAEKAGVAGRLRFEEKDLYEADVREASVVTLYLLTSVNLKLRPKLLAELRPGTRIVSNTFDMGDWKPDQEINIDGRRILMWTVPPRAAAR